MNHGTESITHELVRDAFVDLAARMSAAWNAGDGVAYASPFTVDCDYIAFDGTHLRGRQQNAAHHQRLFDTVLRRSRLEFEDDIDLRLLSDGAAVVHAKGSVRMPWQRILPAKRRSIQTYVLVRQSDGWHIAAFQNARIRPMTLPNGWALRALLAAMRLRAALAGASTETGTAASHRIRRVR